MVTFDKGAKLERIEAALKSPVVALKQIGVVMVAESQKAFRDQKLGADAWPARRVPNVFGIIQDFHDGKSAPPARRFEARPALRDTGRLAASIAFQVIGRDAVQVGTAVEYAEAHQTGGKVESKPITEQVRAALWRWLKRKPRDLKRKLGWLLNKKFVGRTLSHNVPARPFVGVTDTVVEATKRIIAKSIMETEK